MKRPFFGALAPVILAIASTSSIAAFAEAETDGGMPLHARGDALGPGLPENPLASPRYVVRAARMRVIDESGPDFLGSDEIVLDFQAGGHRVTTGIYGDMDTGDEQSFRVGNRCITPLADMDGLRNNVWTCHLAGQGGDVTFLITLYEHDGWVRDTIPTEFCGWTPSDLSGYCPLLQESTVLASQMKSFSEAELLADMPNVGDHAFKTLRVGPCENETCGGWFGGPGFAVYDVDFQIIRREDAIIGGQPVARAGEGR